MRSSLLITAAFLFLINLRAGLAQPEGNLLPPPSSSSTAFVDVNVVVGNNLEVRSKENLFLCFFAVSGQSLFRSSGAVPPFEQRRAAGLGRKEFD
jgi:hypothetical protein